MEDVPFLHPTRQTLQAYGLGRLDDSSSDAVGKHLDVWPPAALRGGRGFAR